MGAVDKRVAVATFAGIAHLRQACGTGGGIRDDLRVHRPALAVADDKLVRQRRPAERLRFNAIDARQRWAVLAQSRGKVTPTARETHQDTLSVVADVACQPQLVRKLPDEGTKSYPLHLAAHPKLYAVNAHCSLKQQR